MFKKRYNSQYSINETSWPYNVDNTSEQSDLPEWEEFTGEIEKTSNAQSDASTDTKPIEESKGFLDISDFPAIRMAQGFNAPIQSENNVDGEIRPDENSSDGGVEGDLSSLIRRYAEMESEDGVPAEDHQTELPVLFRQNADAECANPEQEESQADLDDIEQEEFTMESELERQQIISAELYNFIENIANETEQENIRRDQSRQASAKKIVVDPYNTSFNSRYDDTEDVLSNTAEIPLTPKYKMEE